MKVLVDTSVWSLALRRRGRPNDPAVGELRSLIDEGRVALIGPIRQELLSGIRTSEAFERLRDHLQPFSDEQRATAERRNLPILTTDADFSRFADILPIRLHGRSRK